MDNFSKEEVQRYSRHFILPEFGEKSQKLLKKSRVLCVGAGGLGSPAAIYLASAGIGTLGIVDFDVVDLSNLQRQILHSMNDVGRAKVDSAKNRLNAINSHVNVVTHKENLNKKNSLELFSQYDLILDGTDNYATRYLINDTCVLLNKPHISASVFRFEGQLTVLSTKDGPCYRCLYPEPPPPGLVPSCGEGGVLGVVPGIIGTLQAAEAIKYLTSIGENLINRLLIIDVLEMKFRTLKIRRNPDCAICGNNPTIKELIDYDSFCGVVTAKSSAIKTISVSELNLKMSQEKDFVILDVREPNEHSVNHIKGAIFIPLGELKHRVSELPEDKIIYIYCKSGKRSESACIQLSELGLKNTRNVIGGIMAWVEEIDGTMNRY